MTDYMRDLWVFLWGEEGGGGGGNTNAQNILFIYPSLTRLTIIHLHLGI